MIKKIYLLWHDFATKKLLVIGSLSKNDDNSYVFKYEKDAVVAEESGCFLPFDYTDMEIHFNSLPPFFAQRMPNSQYYIKIFNLNYDLSDELTILCHGNSVKNNDNFSIVSEQFYKNSYKLDGNYRRGEGSYPMRK